MAQQTELAPETLRGIKLFNSLSDAELADLATIGQALAVGIGERFIHEGDTSRDLYVLHRGAVRVLKQDDDGPVELASPRAEAVFGEMALVQGHPRAASVEAIQPSELIRLDADAFHAWLAAGQLTAYKLAYAILERLTIRQACLNREIIGLSAQAAQCADSDTILNLRNSLYEQDLV